LKISFALNVKPTIFNMARLKLSVILFILAAAAVAPIFALPIPTDSEESFGPMDKEWIKIRKAELAHYEKNKPLPPLPPMPSTLEPKITQQLRNPVSEITGQHIHSTHDHKGSEITQVLRNSETTGQHKGSEITKHSNATPGPKPESQLAVPTTGGKHLRFESGATGFSSFRVQGVKDLAEKASHTTLRWVGIRPPNPKRPVTEDYPLQKSKFSKAMDMGVNVTKKGVKKGVNVAKKKADLATNGTKKFLKNAMSVVKPRNTN
jgi:hypothetical protein